MFSTTKIVKRAALLYASEHEIKYIKAPIKTICIGYQAKYLKPELLKDIDLAILFGSCGLLYRKQPFNTSLLEMGYWYNMDGDCIETDKYIPDELIRYRGVTVNYSVKTSKEAYRWRGKGMLIVDQESYHVAKMCKELGKDFRIIRYPIDGCDEIIRDVIFKKYWRLENRIYNDVPGLKYLWRIKQNYIMQKKFQRFLYDTFF